MPDPDPDPDAAMPVVLGTLAPKNPSHTGAEGSPASKETHTPVPGSGFGLSPGVQGMAHMVAESMSWGTLTLRRPIPEGSSAEMTIPLYMPVSTAFSPTCP